METKEKTEKIEKIATRDGFGKAIVNLGNDKKIGKKVYVLSASVGDSTKAFDFKKNFPERYIETGIAEANMIGISAGLALTGKIPFATAFASFLPGRCYDQIRQSVCYSNLNVKLIATHAGLTVGPDGATHQMMEDIAMLRALPNLKIIIPSDAIEAEKATYAIAYEKGPFYLRLGREKMPIITDKYYNNKNNKSKDKINKNNEFKIGKANKLKEGKDLTIIATGIMVYYALLAAEELEKQKISVRVINMHTIKPIDSEEIIKAAKETKAIITAEEHQIYGGLGSAVSEVLSQNYPKKIKIIGMQDKFGESGEAKELLEKYNLNEKEIIKEALLLLNNL
ncbi:MAG: transketolase family protein [Candidatus Woesearchaeota archaeon]